MRGRESIPSYLGAFLSFGIAMVMLVYASIKFSHLMMKHNPTIASFTVEGDIDPEDRFNFRDNGLKFAFGIEGFIDQELKEDPRYVKFFARLYGFKDGEIYEKFIPVHHCTSEELDDFATPVSEAQGLVNAFKNQPKRNLYCIDWEKYGDELEIWSTENDENTYQRFEYVLMPCNYVHAEVSDINDTVAEECVRDRQAQIDYLGNIRLIFLVTE